MTAFDVVGAPLVPFTRDTVPRIFYHMVDRMPGAEALRMRAGGRWQGVTYREVERLVARAAAGLAALGIRSGDRIALLSENRAEWAIVDYAALALGAVDVPIYPSLTAPQIGALLRHADATVIVVSTARQLAKLQAIRQAAPLLASIVALDAVDLPSGVTGWSELLGAVAGGAALSAVREKALVVQPDDLATIIYTSGTSGEPKGVMLSHRNLAAMVAATHQHGTIPVAPGQVVLSVLPLAHALERAADYYFWDCGATIVYPESYDRLAAAMRTARPHVLVGVPLLFERIRREALHAPGIQGRLMRWAAGIGEGVAAAQRAGIRLPWQVQLAHVIATRLIFPQFRRRLGGRLHVAISGGAPLAPETGRFFFTAGIPLYEGYGLTETAPVLAANRPGAVRLGTVGIPYPGVALRSGSDGEVLARGPSVMQGYWRDPRATASAIDPAGWLHTGDQGAVDSDGFLRITGRLKDLIVTSNGKKVAPEPLEERARRSPYVLQAVLVGERRPYLCMLVVPAWEQLAEWAARHAIAAATREDLGRMSAVQAMLLAEVLAQLADCAPFERPHQVLVLPAALTVEAGLLTPTLKVKRAAVEQRYAAEIDALYAAMAGPSPR